VPLKQFFPNVWTHVHGTLVGLSVAVALVAFHAPHALASTAAVHHGVLEYTAAPGEANRIELSSQYGYVVLKDTGVATVEVSGRACDAHGTQTVYCKARDVRSVVLELGDGDDTLSGAAVAPALQVVCGAGFDTVDAADSEGVAADCETVPGRGEPPPVPPPVEEPIEPTPGARAPMEISDAPVTVDAQGRVPIEVACPAESTSGCAGRVTLALPSAAKPGAKAAAKAQLLGRSRPFKVAAGKTKVVRVGLSRRSARIIKRRGRGRKRVKLAVTVEVRSATGTQAATSLIAVRLRRR
jgi:hypothetical protein